MKRRWIWTSSKSESGTWPKIAVKLAAQSAKVDHATVHMIFDNLAVEPAALPRPDFGELGSTELAEVSRVELGTKEAFSHQWDGLEMMWCARSEGAQIELNSTQYCAAVVTLETCFFVPFERRV